MSSKIQKGAEIIVKGNSWFKHIDDINEAVGWTKIILNVSNDDTNIEINIFQK